MREVSFLVFFLAFQAAHSYDHAVFTPKGLRVGGEETGYLNLHGYQSATLTYYLQDWPGLQLTFNQYNNIPLDQAKCSKPIPLKLKVESKNIAVFRLRQTVLLTIKITNSKSNFVETVEMYVSKKSGYIFLATDRPIYRPGENVKIRAFPLTQTMKPSTTMVEILVQTPDRISLDRNRRRLPQNYQMEMHFPLPPDPVFGKWIVIAKFIDKGRVLTAKTNFMVQRYVLPTFQVTIDTKPFVLMNDLEITGKIKASYSYGEKVTGNYFLTISVKKTPESAPVEFYKRPGLVTNSAFFGNGEKSFSVPVVRILSVLKAGETIASLVQQKATIRIAATVTGEADGILESAATGDIPLVRSPYTISQYRFVKFYTPKLTYVLQLDVEDAVKGKKQNDVPVTIKVHGCNKVFNANTKNGQINYNIGFCSQGEQTLTVTTKVVGLPQVDQASVVLKVKPYHSKSGSFLQVTTNNHNVKKGDRLQVTFFVWPTSLKPEIRYFVVSRGTMVHAGVTKPEGQNLNAEASFLVTQAMIPSSRVVAYYFNKKEIVSVSMWFSVQPQCENELTVTVPKQVLPGADINFNLKGPPNAVVTLIGVDRAAYFLYNNSRLSRDTMFKEMEAYDQACLRSSGPNGVGVFAGAGLLVGTSSIQPLRYLSLDCDKPAVARKKRQAVDLDFDPKLEGKLNQCRNDGLKSPSNVDDCEKRAKRVLEQYESIYPGCYNQFLSACINATTQRNVAALRGQIARSNAADNGLAAAERAAGDSLREDFKESLIFKSTLLNELGEGLVEQSAKDSITTYDIDATSMVNSKDGFCISKSTHVRSFKDVFIQLYVPYSLKKLEQANLRISVFNYNSDEDYALRLFVKPGKDFCTYYTPDNWTQVMELGVLSNSASSAKYTVLPLRVPKTKKIPIEVKVETRNGRVLDHVRKEILIEEPGEVKDISPGSYPIDLMKDRQVNFKMDFPFPIKFVPDSRKCTIYAYANLLGPSIEVDPVTKEPRSVESIFRKPFGCGEQNMLVTGPNVFVQEYLVVSKKIAPGTPRWTASIQRMKEGFNREMDYRTKVVASRPWAVFTGTRPSTWLNAYVDKVFSKMKKYYTAMDVSPVCTSYKWLLSEQMADGHFREQQAPYHREMHGAVGGKLTLTAYVTISLLESQSICLPSTHAQMLNAATRAINFLKANKNKPAFNRPYGAALFTYTSALYDKYSALTIELHARLLTLKTETDDHKFVYWKARPEADVSGTDIHNYWYKVRPQAVDVEATAYAVLALIEIAKQYKPPRQSDLDFIRKIVMWLISQRNDGGAFVSTQDTVIGLQALATYQAWVTAIEPAEVKNNIELTFKGADGTDWGVDLEEKIGLTDDNEGFPVQIAVPKNVLEQETVSVNAAGTGQGVVTYRCTYRTEVEEEACHFNLDVQMELVNKVKYEEEGATMIQKITITVTKPGNATEMAIVDVGLMSGFKPVIETLDKIAVPNAVDGLVERYEVTKQNVVLYLRRITSEPVVIVFHLEQFIPVDRPQAAKVNVYDYYEPWIQCGKFYSLPGQLSKLRKSSCGKDEVCRCAEGACPTCRTELQQMNDSWCPNRLPGQSCTTCPSGDCLNVYQKACESNYVFVVRVTEPPASDSNTTFVEFSAKIVKSLKKGTDIGVQKDSNRTFLTRSDCQSKCIDKALRNHDKSGSRDTSLYQKGVDLLVIGNIQDKYKVKNVVSEKYELGPNSYVMKYVGPDECVTSKATIKKFKCKNPKKKRTARQEAKCAKALKMLVACKNMKIVEYMLLTVCD